jgi:membrane protease YdiL (CAAX protease family)
MADTKNAMKAINPYNPWHWIGMLAVLWYSLFGGLFMTLGVPFGRPEVYPSDHGQFVAFWSKVYVNEWLFGVIVLACLWRSGERFRSIGLVRPQLRTVVLLAIGLAVLAILVSVAPEGVRLSLATDAERRSFPATHVERVFLLFAACLTAPFCEELMYRGFLLAYLRAIVGLPPAVVLQALLFGYQHVVLGGWRGVGAMLFGLVIAPLAIAQDNLWPAIAIHFLFDGVVLVAAMLGP